jgi:large subunit ribosomal protein L14
MLIKGSRCQVADNSGALEVEVIGIYGGTSKKTAVVGDFIKIAVKKIIPNNKNVKMGEVVKALVVRTKYPTKNNDGGFSFAGDNAVILLSENNQIKGSRVTGFVCRSAFEKKDDNIRKILTLCEMVC